MVIGLAVGPACLAGPLARSIVCLVCGRGGWVGGQIMGLVPSSVLGELWGPGERGPRPGDVGGIRWVIVLVPRHGSLSGPGATASPPHLRMAGVGLAPRVLSGALSLHCR